MSVFTICQKLHTIYNYYDKKFRYQAKNLYVSSQFLKIILKTTEKKMYSTVLEHLYITVTTSLQVGESILRAFAKSDL